MLSFCHTLWMWLIHWMSSSLPWQRYQSIHYMLDAQPTFLCGEILFISLSILCLLHAWRHGWQHLFTWAVAVCAGLFCDVFFMVLPFIDNFFHAQGTLMLTPRLPLYIPCVYICFVYLSTVSAWRLRYNGVVQAAATGSSAPLRNREEGRKSCI